MTPHPHRPVLSAARGAADPASARRAATARPAVSRDLRAVLLLAGSVGRNELADGIDRPVLDLPVDDARTLLDVWLDHFEGLARALGGAPVEVRMVVNRSAQLPRVPDLARHERVVFAVERDPAEYRGTAGLVRDLTRGYEPEDRVLVVAGNQVLREPLREVFDAMARHDEAVGVVPHHGDDVAAAFLLRCGRLSDVPELGFVDLKEQALPSSRGAGPLRLVRRAAGASIPVRTLAQYVSALRALHAPGGVGTERVGSGRSVTRPGLTPPEDDAFAETWRPVFSIVEPGAHVGTGAVLQDSVVLAGGRVEAGAVVAQSVVCPGGVVPRGSWVLQEVVR